MTNKYKSISYFLILILTLAVMMTTASSQLHGSPGSAPSISTQDQDETLSDLIKQNQAVAGDLGNALKNKNEENKMKVRDAIDLAQSKIDEGINVIDKVLPNLHIKDDPMIIDIINFMKEYKQVAVMIIGGLVTAFQMVFGGGLSYITSQMKNLSGHKMKIEQGFDLQFEIYQKQKQETDKGIKVSQTFIGLFNWLNITDKKQIKLILGSTGVGFSTSIKKWIQDKKKQEEKEKRKLNYIYYDLSEPMIRINNETKIDHMKNLSSIIYSLLYQDDRNFILRIFKSFIKLIFTKSMNTLELIRENYGLVIIFVITYIFVYQLIYVLILYKIIELICDFIKEFGNNKFTIRFDQFKTKFTFKAKKINTQSIKIVIDNFQFLRGEFQNEFMVSQLDKNAQLKTFQQHEKKFITNLTDLVNDVVSLMDLGTAEVILIVKNSQFYKHYLEKLRLNSANVFKVKKLIQLPSDDSQFTIKQRINKFITVINQDKSTNKEIQTVNLARTLILFHNNSKEIMKILRQVNLDKKYCNEKNNIQLKTQRQYFSDILDSSMRQVFTHVDKLQSLIINTQQNKSHAQSNYKKYIGLFLGCLHKKVLFFANRKESENNEKNKKLSQIYQQVVGKLNRPQDRSKPKLLSSIAPGNKRYLFDKKHREFAFKNDAKLLLLKWDDLIQYIETHNDWAQSLENDFTQYYIQNRKSLNEAKKIDHLKYHKIYLSDEKQEANRQPVVAQQPQNKKAVKQHPDPLTRYLQNAVGSSQNNNDPEFDHELLVNEAKRTLYLITDFLTEKQIITQHTFFSRSMALANFYVQEKMKEQLLYEYYKMKQCKLLNKIKWMKPLVLQEKKNMFKKNVEQFMAKSRQDFQYYVEHEAKSYEHGMDWLNRYFCTSVNCSLNPQEIQQARKYMLTRTSSGYFLHHQLSNILLYWRNFEGSQAQKAFSNSLNKLKQGEQPLQGVFNSRSTMITYCALWYYERVTREERFSNALLGWKFDQLKQPMINLQKLRAKDVKRRYKQGNFQEKDKDFKTSLKECIRRFIEYGQKCSDVLQNQAHVDVDVPYMNKSVKDKLNQAIDNYLVLLKEFKPDELFKQIGLSYRYILYTYETGRYRLSQQFKNLVLAYNYAKLRENGVNINSAVKMLFSELKLINISQRLTPQVIISLLRNGKQIQEQLKKCLQNKEEKISDYPYVQKVLLTDFKYLVAAFCWSSGQKQGQ